MGPRRTSFSHTKARKPPHAFARERPRTWSTRSVGSPTGVEVGGHPKHSMYEMEYTV